LAKDPLVTGLRESGSRVSLYIILSNSRSDCTSYKVCTMYTFIAILPIKLHTTLAARSWDSHFRQYHDPTGTVTIP